MLLLLLRRGCRRRRRPCFDGSGLNLNLNRPRTSNGTSSNGSNGRHDGDASEVDAAERAAWRRQHSHRHHHRHHHKNKPPPVLAQLDPGGILVDEEDGRRGFEGSSYELRFGDHVLVTGANASGKSAFWQALSGRRSLLQPQQGDGAGGSSSSSSTSSSNEDVGGSKALMYMSFDMHEEFLEKHGRRVVADVLGGASDPLARRLIVTLGLYPLWYKKISWLSTGEVRRVLLAAVLSKAPRVVVLDKPYDGLDGPSRANLRMILSQLCQGFPRLLVDLGLARRSITNRTSILITHRHEEVPEEVTRVVGVEGLGIGAGMLHVYLLRGKGIGGDIEDSGGALLPLRAGP
jgi:energy-coupling factor transporter ATP-binding protein EcfA2